MDGLADCWWSSYGIDSHKKETKSVIDYCNINKTPLARYLSVIYLYFTLRDVLARFLNVRCSVTAQDMKDHEARS